jgi:uncharacterized protein (TIGR02246 family)
VLAYQPEDLHQLFAARVNARDVDGLVELYEPDAVTYDLQGNRHEGAEALRAMLTGLVSIVDHIEGETRKVTVHDDLALLSGGWRATGTGPDGQPAALTGTNAEIARRQPDGSWRFVIDDPTGGAA